MTPSGLASVDMLIAIAFNAEAWFAAQRPLKAPGLSPGGRPAGYILTSFAALCGGFLGTYLTCSGLSLWSAHRIGRAGGLRRKADRRERE